MHAQLADAVARVLQEDVRVNRLWDLIADNDSVGGKLGTSALIAVAAFAVGVLGGRMLARRVSDRYRKYYTRRSRTTSSVSWR